MKRHPITKLMFLAAGFGMAVLLPFASGQTGSEDNDDSSLFTLNPFEVTGGQTSGYGAQFSSSSSRLNLDYLDVPQTVNVVTSEFLDDAFIFDSREFSMYVTSAAPRTNTHQEETFFVRGLQTTTSYVEGFLATRAVNRDSALYSRVEYVKGPASAAIGRGEAGGLVNFVQKKPIGAKQTKLTTILGSDSFYRFAIDHNDSLLPDGKLDFRIPLYFQESDDPRGGPVMHTKKYGIGPALVWRPTEKTTINFTTALFEHNTPGAVASAHWMHQDLVDMRVDLNGINPDVWYPGPDTPLVPFETVFAYEGNNRRAKVAEGSIIVNHQFTDSLSLRLGFRGERIQNDVKRFNTPPAVALNPDMPSGYQITMSYRRDHNVHKGIRSQADLLYEAEFLGGEHSFLAGVDTYDTSTLSQHGQRGGLYLDLYQPDLTPPPEFGFDTWVSINNNSDNRNWGHGFGYYGQYMGSYFDDHIKVMAGWRKDETNISSQNIRAGNPRGDNRKEFTDAPRYSISYQPVDWLSVYYLHSIQADPLQTRARWSDDVLLNGATSYTDGRRPEEERLTSAVEATLEEIGLKAQFLDNRLTTSLAYYDMSRDGFFQNEVKTEPGANGIGTIQYSEVFIADGEQAHGIELEVFGQLTPELTLAIAATRPEGTNPRADGTIVPIDKLFDEYSVNGKYDFRGNDKNGFVFTGGGKVWKSGWLISNASFVEFTEDQYVVNAGLSYYWGDGRYNVTARGNNLLDDHIIISENSQYKLQTLFLSFSADL